MQLNGRLHRQGQVNAVVVHYIVSNGTVDEEIVACLHRKGMTQARLLAAIKDKVEKTEVLDIAA